MTETTRAALVRELHRWADEMLAFANDLDAATQSNPASIEARRRAKTLRAAANALEAAEREIKGWRAYKRGVEEALNSGDGSYRP